MKPAPWFSVAALGAVAISLVVVANYRHGQVRPNQDRRTLGTFSGSQLQLRPVVWATLGSCPDRALAAGYRMVATQAYPSGHTVRACEEVGPSVLPPRAVAAARAFDDGGLESGPTWRVALTFTPEGERTVDGLFACALRNGPCLPAYGKGLAIVMVDGKVLHSGIGQGAAPDGQWSLGPFPADEAAKIASELAS